jgi:uncharacterized membrane protein
MTSLVLAAPFFVGIDPMISEGMVRARLVASVGESRYRGSFSLLSDRPRRARPRLPRRALGVRVVTARVTRHPFLVGMSIWAATHALVRGDAASIVFFSAFLFLGLTGPSRVDRRQRAADGDERRRFDDATSVIPFAALFGGRNRFVFGEIGCVRCGVALAIHALVLLVGHRLVFGVAPLG